MRHVAISDIHGCYTALQTLLGVIGLRDDDVLITLGDYVDRGPDTARVLDRLIGLERAGRLIALRGNHDIQMLEARDSGEAFVDWLDSGGDAVLASYGERLGRRAELDDVPDEHWAFLQRTRPYYEIDTHFFVHANAMPGVPLSEQPDWVLYWQKLTDPEPHESGKVMICGHTSQRSFQVLDLGHTVCIDTRCFGGGWLTALDPATGEYWQANQKGETRRKHLRDNADAPSRR